MICLRCGSILHYNPPPEVVTLEGEYRTVLCQPCRNDYVGACQSMLEWRVLVAMRTEAEIALARVRAGGLEAEIAAQELRAISEGFDLAVMQMHQASKQWVEKGKPKNA